MPCGGIYPVENHFSKDYFKPGERCYCCNKPIQKLEVASFCEEWDAFLHRCCIVSFMKTAEGKVISNHGHVVYYGGME